MGFFIQTHLTRKCQSRCAHCYQDGWEGADAPVSAWESFIRQTVVDFEPHFGQLTFNVTGGDPLAYAGIWELAEVINSTNSRWSLLSSGAGIDRDIAARLRGLGVESVQISLEGFKPVNDAIRGKGSYARAMSAISVLRSSGVKVSIAATVTAVNADELENFTGWAREENLPLGLHRHIAMGAGAMPGLSGAEWGRVVERMARKRVDGFMVWMNDPLFYVALAGARGLKEFPQKAGFAMKGCSAGVGGVTVMEDGSVYPCRKIPETLGNVFETSLWRIWMDSPLLWRLRRRNESQGPCSSCRWMRLCGGCRAHAMLEGRGLDGADPYCGN
ncbi:MAG: radical SAM protein [Nitrospinae bacterium]|nr:radical SAM protein [Nitrospinota bacterium]